MKRTVSESEFVQAFKDYGRDSSWSGTALEALYYWLVDLEDYMDVEMELDVVALDCDFAEYDTALDAAQEYGYEPDEDDLDGMDAQDIEDLAREWLEQRTTVIEADGSVVVQGF